MENQRVPISTKTLDSIPITIADDDEIHFLSEIEAAEARALSSAKRRRFNSSIAASDSPSSSATIKIEKKMKDHQPKIEKEGAYIAALKGSKSQLWQKSTALSTTASAAFSGGGDGCFKCGKVGHWARDCEGSDGGGDGGKGADRSGVDVAEKECRCGVGVCSVLTANTERNRGRKFYKCPVREENGGCGFFEWCDKASATNTSFEERPGYNMSQQFYSNPASQGSSSFVKASSDWTTDGNGKSSIARTGSTCFKCNKEGHWARDCPTASSTASTVTRGDSTSSGSCYKCGKLGHWARDCSQSQAMPQKW
ncbi:hypothetical protein Droror1_Dr00019620 [Drosera rotundifolia]